MVSSAAYADSNIKINVDDASRVSIKVNGVALKEKTTSRLPQVGRLK